MKNFGILAVLGLVIMSAQAQEAQYTKRITVLKSMNELLYYRGDSVMIRETKKLSTRSISQKPEIEEYLLDNKKKIWVKKAFDESDAVIAKAIEKLNNNIRFYIKNNTEILKTKKSYVDRAMTNVDRLLVNLVYLEPDLSSGCKEGGFKFFAQRPDLKDVGSLYLGESPYGRECLKMGEEKEFFEKRVAILVADAIANLYRDLISKIAFTEKNLVSEDLNSQAKLHDYTSIDGSERDLKKDLLKQRDLIKVKTSVFDS